MEEEEALRVRVVFDDRKLLTKPQRSEGLKRCWLLLRRPSISTISDLASYILTSFNLKLSCPHGLLLSMDDFVLPPFESTSILKDKDIIRVRKKDAIVIDVIELGDYSCQMQCSGVLEKQNTVSSDKLLPIREFGEDSGCETKNDKELCTHNENAIHTGTKSKRKIKHPDGIEGSKRKKLKTSSKEPNTIGDVEEDTAGRNEDIHLGKTLESSKRGSSRRGSHKKAEMPSRNGNIVSQLKDNVAQGTSSDQREKRRKKSRLTSTEKSIRTAEGAENISREQKQSNSQKEVNVARDLHMKNKQSGEDGTHNAEVASQPSDNVNKNHSSMLMEESRNAPADKDSGGSACELHDNVTKIQSRSARRKKAKRKWLRELKSQDDQNKEMRVSPNVIHRESPEQQEIAQATELEKEIVPVVIRPGHIRFQPLDEECSQGQSQETMETFQWNGTTSKKKGQKWGREKTMGNWNNADGYNEPNEKNIGSKRNDANDYKGQELAGEKTVSKWNDTNGYNGETCDRDKTMTELKDSKGYKEQSNRMEKTANKLYDANGYTEQYSAKGSKWKDANGEHSDGRGLSEKGQRGSSQIDFESLLPLARIPQVGDVLAYRLIELSSSWCPEVSSYRVGQVTSYDHVSMSVTLVPVPEFPIISEENTEQRDSMVQENSLYNEDGSLQIHFQSLVDVRLLKASIQEETTPHNSRREVSTNELAAPLMNNSELDDTNAEETVAQAIEKGNANESVWDQIKQALEEKRAQLQKKDGCDEGTPNKSNAGTSGLYKALRRSAVGPTLAYLRGRKDEDTDKK